MSSESQRSISEWASVTFGNPVSARAASRAIEEMEEFVRAYEKDFGEEELLEEAADIVICLYVFASSAGFDLHDAIDRKMRINRRRKWRKNGDGTGYHIKDSSP